MKKKTTKKQPESHVQKQYFYKVGKDREMIEVVNSREDDVFWTAFEPKAKNRFIVYIKDKKGITVIPPYVIRSADRPSVALSCNSPTVIYRNMNFECYDPIVPSTTQSVMKAIYENNTIWDITMKILGPVGDTVEEWEIKDAHLEEVFFSGFDWRDTGEPASVFFTVKPGEVKLKF